MRTNTLLRKLRLRFDPDSFDWSDNENNLGRMLLDILGLPSLPSESVGLRQLTLHLDYLIPLDEELSRERLLDSIRSGEFKDPVQVKRYLDRLIQCLGDESPEQVDGLLQLTA
jgi:hypothetical protein